MMDLEVDICCRLPERLGSLESSLRRKSRSLGMRGRNRDCMVVITLLVSQIRLKIVQKSLKLTKAERLKKDNATVLLQIQADMLGYHVVSLTSSIIP